MEGATDAKQAQADKPNLIHVWCDDVEDWGTIKLHTPYGELDIEVQFIEKNPVIQIDVCHTGHVSVGVYRNHGPVGESIKHAYEDEQSREEVEKEFDEWRYQNE